jgi:hypothetical protein
VLTLTHEQAQALRVANGDTVRAMTLYPPKR